MIFLTIIKFIISGIWSNLIKLFDIILTHWHIILPVAIVILGLLQINALTNQRDEINGKYNDLVMSIQKAKEIREAELKIIREQGKKDLAEVTKKHKDDISKIMRKANNEKTISDSAINNYRDGLRLAIERETSLRLSKDDTNQSTRTDSNATTTGYVETLEHAGAVCAADYNLCREHVIKNQHRIGVE